MSGTECKYEMGGARLYVVMVVADVVVAAVVVVDDVIDPVLELMLPWELA